MAEYIEREKLLERIDDIWDCADMVFEPNDHCCRADDCASCKWAETKKAIRKIVANFSAADVRPVEWIPVTERLPEMLDGENISKEVYVTDGTDIAETFLMRDYDGFTSWGYAGIGKITHWCEQIPLPQPPKGE